MAQLGGRRGYHILADLWGCPQMYLEEADKLGELLLEAAKAGGFRVVGQCFYQFNPRGATGVVLLELSHISAHTWPELGFIALDIYSCGGKRRAKKTADYLFKALKPVRVQVREVDRYR